MSKKKKKKLNQAKDIFVLRVILPNHYDSENKAKVQYFLGIKDGKGFREYFTDIKLKQIASVENAEESKLPLIEEAKPLFMYTNKFNMTKKELFAFILNFNTYHNY